jgi:DNA-binding response OmpR family regulator
MPKTILIVEDDVNIRELLQLYLSQEGYQIETAGDGLEGLRAFKRIHPDLVLLDLMMPVMDGTQTMREIRAISKTPVIILTAKGETFDKVNGLELGADDYITKPFEMREVIARIHAVLRRFDSEEAPKKLEFDNLIIDKESYNIVVKGEKMEIPPKEIELLYFLASSPNRVFTRAQLLDDVWGFDYFGDTRTVDVHVKRLREKLQNVSPQWEIKTVWGVGYKFELLDGSGERQSQPENAPDKP